MLNSATSKNSSTSRRSRSRRKKSKFDRELLNQTASMLKALAHPMRIAIVELLEKKEELNVTDIYETLDLEQAVASHHLSILRNNGILETERHGKMIFYSVQEEKIERILHCIDLLNEPLN